MKDAVTRVVFRSHCCSRGSACGPVCHGDRNSIPQRPLGFSGRVIASVSWWEVKSLERSRLSLSTRVLGYSLLFSMATQGALIEHYPSRFHTASGLSTAQYFASTMIIVGLSVVVTVIVLRYHHHDPDGGKMPKWVRPVSSESASSPWKLLWQFSIV